MHWNAHMCKTSNQTLQLYRDKRVSDCSWRSLRPEWYNTSFVLRFCRKSSALEKRRNTWVRIMVEVIYQLRTIHRTSTVHLSPSLRFRIIGFIIF